MKKGFTLLELIIVVIVIAVLAAIALPRMIRVINKARVAEGYTLLNGLREAQLRYFATKEGLTGTGVYAGTTSDLDIEFTTRKHFTTVTTGSGTAANLGAVTATTPAVTLSISADGVVTCTGTDCGPLGL